MRRVTVALLVGFVAQVASPAGGIGNSDPYRDIRALLDGRAEAMLAGDRETFLASIDPRSRGFRRRQGRLFDGFHRLGLSEYRLDLSQRLWPELTTDREVARYGAGAHPTVLHVEERYALGEYDEQPALEDLFLTFVRRPEGWRVASDSDLDDVALYSGRKLWEFAPVVAQASEHFLYVSHPGLLAPAGPILGAAEEALDTVSTSWPLGWNERVVILAPSTSKELRRLIQATFDLDVFVAFAASGVDRARDWDLVGHRILLNWPNFSRYDESTQRTVLAHELLHVATREYSGPLLPIFVEEGIGEWVAGQDSASLLSGQVRNGSFDRLLPRDHEFISGSDAVILSAYQESSSAVRFAVERFGEDSVADFYRELGAVRRRPGTWRYHVGSAMQEAFGVGFDEFQGRWATWLEGTLN